MLALCSSGEVLQPVQPGQSWAAGAAPDTWHQTMAEPIPCFQMKLISAQARSGHRNDLSCSALRAKSHLYPLILNCNPLWDSLNCSALKGWGSGTDTECWVRTAESGADSAAFLRSEMWQRREAAGNGRRCFQRKHFEPLLVYCCLHLSHFPLAYERPDDCCHCLGGWTCHSYTALEGFRAHQALSQGWLFLSKDPVNDSRIWSVLRGQVPCPQSNPPAQSTSGICNNNKSLGSANSGKGSYSDLLIAGMDLKGHKCDLPPS